MSPLEGAQSAFTGDDDNEQENFSYACHLVYSSVLPMSLQAAVKLEVFEIIAKAGASAKLSASEIASQMPTTNVDASMMLDRILRLLASHSIVNCSLGEDGNGKPLRLYSLTPASKYFVCNRDGVSMAPMIALLQDKVSLYSWKQLRGAVLEGGIPFNRVYGVHAFEYLGKDPRFNQVFNAAMFNSTTITMKKIVESYKGFDNLKQVVDVGGGLGNSLAIITSKYPSIKGVNFDLPHIIESAPTYPGIEHVGGDMFECVPKGDALSMKCILHDWNDNQCLKLLKNCHKSIPEDGKVIVIESVLSSMPDTSISAKFTAKLDVLMMTLTPGGKERTREEFISLATRAGFRGVRFECLIYNFWVMEFFK